jgi:hypothetical protein
MDRGEPALLSSEQCYKRDRTKDESGQSSEHVGIHKFIKPALLARIACEHDVQNSRFFLGPSFPSTFS